MNESPNKRAVIVGLFVLIGISFLIAGILTIGNLHETFKRKMRVVSVFEDVNGLLPGSNIWFSGVKVGTVHDLYFHGKSQVEVVLSIDRNVQQYIRKDAKVKVSTDGLIGNKIIVIFGGTTQLAQIEEGDTLRAERSLSTEDMMATFQESNKNLLSITNDIKSVSHKIHHGEGTIGKFLNDNAVYDNANSMTKSLERASNKAENLIASLSNYSSNLNKKGTLANDLVTDTVVFNSMKSSFVRLKIIADSASALVTNLKEASKDPKSPVGVLLHDHKTGADLRETIQNLDSSSVKLNRNLDVLQYSFLLRGAYRKEAKAKKKEEKNSK